MPTYRVLCADLVSNTIREELAVQDLQYSLVLNGAGAFSGWISLDDPKCTRANLDPGATAIYVERGGQLVWGGILWSAQVDTVERRLHLQAEGFWSYFRHRYVKNRLGTSYTADGNVTPLYLDADVAKSNILGAPSPTNFYDDISSPTINVSTNYLISFVPGSPAQYEASAAVVNGLFGGFTINGVRLIIIGAGTQTVTPYLKIGGTTYSGTGGGFNLTDPSVVSYTWTTNPATTVAWTSSDISAFDSASSFGFLSGNIVTTGDLLIYHMRLEIIWGASDNLVYSHIDQLAIARDLISNAVAQPGSLTGITVGTELTTDNGGKQQTRSTIYYSYERREVAQSIEQMAATMNGFDFSIEVAWSGTTPTRTFKLYYPRRGRRIDGLVFNHNIQGISKVGLDVNATVIANSIDVIGSGDANAMLIASSADTSLLTRYPLLERVISAKDILNPDTLQDLSAAEVGRNRLPLELPSIEKQASIWPDFGSFQVGDEAYVVTQDNWINIGSYQRVQQIEVSVSSEGQEIMVPSFVSSDAVVY